MVTNDEVIFEIAGLLREATALSDAALGNDIDDMRNRAYRIIFRTENTVFLEIATAASNVLDFIEENDELKPGCGRAMLELAIAIQARMDANL